MLLNDTRALSTTCERKRCAIELVDLVAVPISGHVGLAERQTAATHDRFIEILVVHADIPRAVAVYLYIRLCEHFFDHFFCLIHILIIREYARRLSIC